MAKLLHHKVVAALPLPLEPDSIYYVRQGDGFDVYVTNGAGVVDAYTSNAAAKIDNHLGSTGAAHGVVTPDSAGFMSPSNLEMMAELESSSISISGPRSVYTDRDYEYTIQGLDSFTEYVVQVSGGIASLDGNKILLQTPSVSGDVLLTVYAGNRARQVAIDVILSQFIQEPAPTPENFGDPLEGGFYAGMLWNRIALCADEKTLSTGSVSFSVDHIGALVYEGQMIEVRSISNPFNKFAGTVTGASTGRITLDVTSIEGGGTHSDWAVMSRFRSILAPKSQGESAPIALKFENTAMPTATQTLTEGWESTNAMVVAGTAEEYPAAHWARELVINGFDDWYIPARDELELFWRNLKPVTTDNYDPDGLRQLSGINYQKDGAYTDAARGRGLNLNSYPQGATYTLTDPAQTTATAFQAGGPEENTWNNYFWSSSEYSAANAWYQYWVASYPGVQGNKGKTNPRRVRAVRRSII